MSSISERVKIVRKSNKLNQHEFATILGISQTHVSKIEAGKDMPSKKLIKNMCLQFNVSKEWLELDIGSMNNSAINDDVLEKDCLLSVKKFLSSSSNAEKLLFTNLVLNLPQLIKKSNLPRFDNSDGYDAFVALSLYDTIVEIFEYIGYLNDETLGLKKSENLKEDLDDIVFMSEKYGEKINEYLSMFQNIFLGNTKNADIV